MPDIKTASRKDIERDARRRFVLDAARRLLSEQSVEDTTMDSIAVEAGYTRRTLYSYFKSRDEILLIILGEDLAQRWTNQQQVVAQAETGLEKVVVWGESLYTYARANRAAMSLQLYWDFKGIKRSRVSPRVFSEFEKVNEELARGLREIFGLGVADHGLRPDLDIDICISQYLYTLRAVIHRALTPTYSFAQFDPDDYVRHYLELFITAIRNPKGATR
jgi:TetR/AcrR family transcriptional regulator